MSLPVGGEYVVQPPKSGAPAVRFGTHFSLVPACPRPGASGGRRGTVRVRCASARGECGQHPAKIIRADGLTYERQIEEGKRKAGLVRRANRMDIATLTIALLAVPAFLAGIPAGARRGRVNVGVGALVTRLLAIGPFPQTSPAPTATGPQPTTRARQGRAGGGFAADWCNGNTLGSFPGAGGSTPSSAIRARRDGAGTGNTPDLGRDATDKGELTRAGVYSSSPQADGSAGGVCGVGPTKLSADYSQPWLPGGHRGARPAPSAPFLSPFLGALP